MVSPYEASQRYPNGRKRCTFCTKYIDINGRRCDECNHWLRGKPRTPQRRKIRDLTIKRY